MLCTCELERRRDHFTRSPTRIPRKPRNAHLTAFRTGLKTRPTNLPLPCDFILSKRKIAPDSRVALYVITNKASARHLSKAAASHKQTDRLGLSVFPTYTLFVETKPLRKNLVNSGKIRGRGDA